MKQEITRIVNVQMTKIDKIDSEDYEQLDREKKELFENWLKEILDLDDAKITNCKDFILDLSIDKE